MKHLGLALMSLVWFLHGCVIVPDTREHQEFVGDREIEGVNLVRKGLSSFQRSRFIDADFAFRQALYLYPDLNNVKFNLALTLEQLGLFEEAESILQGLMKDKAEALAYLDALGHIYYSAERYGEAEKLYQQSLDLALEREDNARAAVISRSLAVLYYKIGREEEALCASLNAFAFQNNLEQVKRHARLLNSLAFYARALSAVEQYWKGKVDRTGPNSFEPELVQQAALAHFGLGQFEESINVIEPIRTKPGLDPVLVSELDAIHFLAERRQRETEGASAVNDSEDEAEEDEEIPQLLLSDLSDERLLYWPGELIEAAEEFRLTQVEDEGW